MVWFDITHTLVTVLTLSLWRHQAWANLPLYSSDIPDNKRGETIELLQKSLLNILGMKERPKGANKDVRVPQYMIDLYQQQTKDPDYMTMYFDKDRSLHANTARSFSHIGTKTHKLDDNIVNLYFNVTDIPTHEDLVSAELQLFPNNTNSTLRYRVEVYEILSGAHSVEKAITRLIDTKIVRPTNSSWVHLDITPAAQKWHLQNKKIAGIQIHVKRVNGDRTAHSHIRLRRDASQSEMEWRDEKPLVVIYSHDRTLSRTKRGSRRRNRGPKRIRSECQRHEMTVNFKDVGWEGWILAPNHYDAYYCHGECPFPLSDHLNATNHAIIQTLVNEVDPEAVPSACCVPTDLSPMALLYLNGEDVVLKLYPDMIVEGCGCR